MISTQSIQSEIIAKIIEMLPLAYRAQYMTLSKSIYKYMTKKGLLSEWWREQYNQIPSNCKVCDKCGIILYNNKATINKHMKKHEQKPNIRVFATWENCKKCDIRYSKKLVIRHGKRHKCVTDKSVALIAALRYQKMARKEITKNMYASIASRNLK